MLIDTRVLVVLVAVLLVLLVLLASGRSNIPGTNFVVVPTPVFPEGGYGGIPLVWFLLLLIVIAGLLIEAR